VHSYSGLIVSWHQWSIRCPSEKPVSAAAELCLTELGSGFWKTIRASSVDNPECISAQPSFMMHYLPVATTIARPLVLISLLFQYLLLFNYLSFQPCGKQSLVFVSFWAHFKHLCRIMNALQYMWQSCSRQYPVHVQVSESKVQRFQVWLQLKITFTINECVCVCTPCPEKNCAAIFLVLTLPNAGWFSNLFQWQIRM